MRKCLLFVFIFSLSLGTVHAVLDTITSCPDQYIMDLAEGPDGSIWAVAEAGSVWHYKDNKWTKFDKTTPGFLDTEDFTAVSIDKQGRVWVGSVNAGIAVYNGEEWKNYDIVTGPAHMRIFDIACSPQKGIVAIAHAAGVSLWNPETDKWSELSPLDGYPNSPANSVAFAKDDTLWIAFEFAGVTYAKPENDYKRPYLFKGRWFWDSLNRTYRPLAACGYGLPTNLTNVILPLKNGDVFCGTLHGLAYRKATKPLVWNRSEETYYPNDSDWVFFRGLEYNHGRRFDPGDSLAEEIEAPFMLREDPVTALCEDGNGIWIGFRKMGVFFLNLEEMKIDLEKSYYPTGEVLYRITSLLKNREGRILAGSYGLGIMDVGVSYNFDDEEENKPEEIAATTPKLPSEALPPTPEFVEQIANEYYPLLPENQVWAKYLYDDWTTKGDWCELYGREYALHCAANAPWEDVFYHTAKESWEYSTKGKIGPVHKETSTLRSWVQWINVMENRNILYQPDLAMRTEAEWDDNGEEFNAVNDGPDMWVKIKAPKTPHQLALYFYNPNSRDGANAKRDYRIEIYEDKNPDAEQIDYGSVLLQEPLAMARVQKFSSGVYKVFCLNGAENYLVRLVRSQSWNTILNGIFISKYKETEPIYDNRVKHSVMAYSKAVPITPLISDVNKASVPENAMTLWNLSDVNQDTRFLDKQYFLRVYALRIAKSKPETDQAFIDLLNWHLAVWDDAKRTKFDEDMKIVWDAHQEREFFYRSTYWRQHSPGVVPFTIEELEAMQLEGIDWKQYRADSTVKPELSVEELKVKLKVKINEIQKKREENQAKLEKK